LPNAQSQEQVAAVISQQASQLSIVDQSTIWNASFRVDPVSKTDTAAKQAVYDAWLMVWAKKMGLSLDQLKVQIAQKIAAGQRFNRTIYYPTLQSNGLPYPSTVDIATAPQIVLWDTNLGFGPSSTTRIQFATSGTKLVIYLRISPNAIPQKLL
jgi:hypothetical protein